MARARRAGAGITNAGNSHARRVLVGARLRLCLVFDLRASRIRSPQGTSLVWTIFMTGSFDRQASAATVR